MPFPLLIPLIGLALSVGSNFVKDKGLKTAMGVTGGLMSLGGGALAGGAGAAAGALGEAGSAASTAAGTAGGMTLGKFKDLAQLGLSAANGLRKQEQPQRLDQAMGSHPMAQNTQSPQPTAPASQSALPEYSFQEPNLASDPQAQIAERLRRLGYA